MDVNQVKKIVVAGGGINDPDSEHGCTLKTRNPLEHGEDVLNSDLNFHTQMINPSAASQCQFPGVPDPGSIGYVLKNVGEAGGILLGLSNTIRNGGIGSFAGGSGLNLMGGVVQDLINQDIGVNIPPNIQESTERGAKVRTINEKGQMHNLGLLEGLPNHGALFNMSGFRLPELPNVPTAKQTNDQMMTQNMLSQLTGQIMSLGQMFQGLMQNGSAGGTGGASAGGGLGGGNSYWQDIHSGLTPAMSAALNSLSNLIQSHETDNGVSYVTGGVVHYGNYLENAVQLLTQVQTLDDVMNVLSRLQWDTSLFGQDKLDNVVIQIENAWGQALQEVSTNGTITVSYANAAAQQAFADSIANSVNHTAASSAPASSSGSGSGSGSGSQTAQQIQSMIGQLFGQSAGTIQEMWKRLASSQEQEAKQMHEKLTQQQEAQRQKQINQATVQGSGDPTSDSNFSVTAQ